ncbi:hypothetical protein ABLE68_18890 [Nocardioides sp. CN2-186]|uniref:hypothetical protein n=1 Tax=Nocardioides tweenelious TaxID=3156607 RepID=UPI0032B36665
MRSSVRTSALALATVAVLGVWSTAGAAIADPKPDHADHGKHVGQDKSQDQVAEHGAGKDADKAKGQGQGKGHQGQGYGNQGQSKGHGNQGQGKGHQGKGHGNGQAHAPGQQPGGGHGDPAGNNGTVKIAGPGDAVGHPSNNPHPGCTFFVEWFGYDEGADVVSTVTFASQAPTSDVVLGGTSPSQVFVGGDSAGGGTDLDGRQAYTLSFSGGAPHPKQGYHVKLTVATPRSQGNDTKTKVFWVEPCASDTPAPGSQSGTGPGATDDDTNDDANDTATEAADQGVLGTSATAPAAAPAGTDADSSGGSAPVPTAVDAGESSSALPEWARSPLPLTLIAFGVVLAGVGIVLRSRSRA